MAYVKTIALTRQTFVGKVMSLLFNMLSGLVITFVLTPWGYSGGGAAVRVTLAPEPPPQQWSEPVPPSHQPPRRARVGVWSGCPRRAAPQALCGCWQTHHQHPDTSRVQEAQGGVQGSTWSQARPLPWSRVGLPVPGHWVMGVWVGRGQA